MSSEYYRANRERIIERQMAYQKAHPEVVRRGQAAYYRRNSAAIQAHHANRAARIASIFRDGYGAVIQ